MAPLSPRVDLGFVLPRWHAQDSACRDDLAAASTRYATTAGNALTVAPVRGREQDPQTERYQSVTRARRRRSGAQHRHLAGTGGRVREAGGRVRHPCPPATRPCWVGAV